MSTTKMTTLLYGRGGMELSVPAEADVLAGRDPPGVANAQEAVRAALADPIGSKPLAGLVAAKRPKTVAVTVSDITRPVPNPEFLPTVLDVLNAGGVADSQIVVIIATGTHRPSTAEERRVLLGAEVCSRVEVIDHAADRPETLVQVRRDPAVHVCGRFASADFRIVTGFIEPHFMAGFSGGRKGVCPGLVDLRTIQRFHGFDALAEARADNGVLEGNPCHEIALDVARAVGVDFLFNVAITRDRHIAGVYCGELEAAHLAGCRQVARWVSADVAGPCDLVVTSGGGYPLDQTFYQTVKGMVGALPALGEGGTLLVVSECSEGIGSEEYAALMRQWHDDWRGFLAHIEANRDRTERDQWEFQMQARVLARTGVERLLLVTDGIAPEAQRTLAVTPVLGEGDEKARRRAQRAIDGCLAARPGARVAVIPDGPYTMLRTG